MDEKPEKRAKVVSDISDISEFFYKCYAAQPDMKRIRRILRGTKEFMLIEGTKEQVSWERRWMSKYGRAIILIEAEKEAADAAKTHIGKHFRRFKDVVCQIVPLKRKNAKAGVSVMLLRRRRTYAKAENREDGTGIDELLLQLLSIPGRKNN